jgi:hypothetical protein
MSMQTKYALVGLVAAAYLGMTCWAALKGEHETLWLLLGALPGAVLAARYERRRRCCSC